MRLAILKTFTVLWLFGMYIVLMLTFLMAYQNPDKVVSISINSFNEAQVEFYMLFAGLIIATFGSIFLISDIRTDFRRRMIRQAQREFRST